MKKIVIAVLAACMLTAPLMAADMSHSASAADQKSRKDECLLYAKKCSSSVDSIQDNIRKLNKEIQKGTKTYSPEELKRLDAKLQEANAILEKMMSNP